MLIDRDLVSFFVIDGLAFFIKEWYAYDNKIGGLYSE
jgi:hypothetical protein